MARISVMAVPMKRGKKKAPKSGASKGEERQPTTKKPRKSKCMNKKERDNKHLHAQIHFAKTILLLVMKQSAAERHRRPQRGQAEPKGWMVP